jgi:hypothetical protein
MAISTEPQAGNPPSAPGLSRPNLIMLALTVAGVLAVVAYFALTGHHSTNPPAQTGNPAAANSPAAAHNGQPAVVPTTPTTVDQAAAIATAWRGSTAAWVANAMAPEGASAQLLDAYYTDPELSTLKKQLAARHRDGLYSRGGIDDVTGTIHATLTSPTQANLSACEVDHLQLLEPNGQPFPGSPGDPTPTNEMAHATMVLTTGGWKVSTVTTVTGPCTG